MLFVVFIVRGAVMRAFRFGLAIFLLALLPSAPARCDELQELVVKLREFGRTPEAIPLAERLVVVVRTRFGAEHAETVPALGLLSNLYQVGGRLHDAERTMRQALAITTAAYGPSDARVADVRSSLAVLVQEQNRLGEAEALWDEVIRIRDDVFGPSDSRVVTGLEMGGLLASLQGKYAKAQRLFSRAVGIVEQDSPIDPILGRLLRVQGSAAGAEGQYAAAEALLRRAVAILEAHDSEADELSRALQELAAITRGKGDYQDSKQLLIRSIALIEKTKGTNDPDLAPALTLLAQVYQALDQDDLVEPLALRAVKLLARAPDGYQLLYAEALHRLAAHYQRSDRHEDAREALLKALAITEARIGREHADVALTLQALARADVSLGRSSEAMALLNRALTIRQKTQPVHHPDYVQVLEELGMLHEKEGRHKEALVHLERALAAATSSKVRYAHVASLHSLLGMTKMSLGDPVAALGHWKAAMEERSALSIFETEGDRKPGIQSPGAQLFIIAAFDLSKLGPSSIADRLAEESFVAAQHLNSSHAASALSKMAARAAARDARLSKLVRRAQDLALAQQRVERSLVTRLGRTLPDIHTPGISTQQNDFAQMRSELEGLARAISVDFPAYSELVAPRPLSVAETRQVLRPDEVAVVVDAYGFVWAVSREATRWYRVADDKAFVGRVVHELRCGLDYTLWQTAEGADKCRKGLNASPRTETVRTGDKAERVQVLPFDLARAHELYKALLGPVEHMIKGKHLIIVPTGPLTTLPFHVLVAEAPKAAIPARLADYRNAAWLGIRQPITVLPSVTALKALREHAKTSRATKPYLGIGNPLLDGPQADPQWGALHKRQAQAARDKQQCPKTFGQRITSAAGRPLAGFAKLFRGPNADIEEVRQWTPLPETADELCEVGRRLGVPESEILLGANASETRLKELSEQGQLSDYGILHFATHGALTGQVQGLAEPGLILTPPAKGTSDAKTLDRDDGFLTSSEIAALKLDADWVILSACNTAGGANENAEALSGMARAFFYAGARALLVSHWEVGSDAAVKLTTRAFAELKRKSGMGRAEAVRISMRELIERGSLAEAHPSMWAPFVLVGEGAR